MAKLKKEELLNELKAYTGDRTDDETLKILEDVSDSFTDAKDDGGQWEEKYNDLARKYKERFTSGSESEETEETEEKTDDEKDDEDIQIDDLFTDEKKDEE